MRKNEFLEILPETILSILILIEVVLIGYLIDFDVNNGLSFILYIVVSCITVFTTLKIHDYFLFRCKHDWNIVYHIGGDIQNTAYECTKCKKHKVESHGSVGKLSYDRIYRLKLESQLYQLTESQKRVRYFLENILSVDPKLNNISYLHDCAHVMQVSAKKALKEIGVEE